MPKLKAELTQLNPEHPVLHNSPVVEHGSNAALRYGLIAGAFMVLFGFLIASVAAVVFFMGIEESQPITDNVETPVEGDLPAVQSISKSTGSAPSSNDQFEIKVISELEPGLTIVNLGSEFNRYPSSYSVLVRQFWPFHCND